MNDPLGGRDISGRTRSVPPENRFSLQEAGINKHLTQRTRDAAALEKAGRIFLDENGEGATEVTFKIRKASTEDAEAIIEVFDHVPFLKDCYRGEAGISLVENNPHIFWLADLDGRVASVMIVQRKYDFGWLEISLIVTKPEFRRRDYARGLIHKAKWIAAESKLDLVAYAENDISRDLFISEQFSLVPGVQSAKKHPMYRFSGTQNEPR